MSSEVGPPASRARSSRASSCAFGGVRVWRDGSRWWWEGGGGGEGGKAISLLQLFGRSCGGSGCTVYLDILWPREVVWAAMGGGEAGVPGYRHPM